jgi:DNA-binding HxlR family transcriptional regulator
MDREIFICHNCPMTRTMATIGTKWKPIIIYTIGMKTVRFGAIYARMGIISKKVLTEQLKELEEDGILIRTEFKEIPPRVEYSLTESGLELLPILNMLTVWNQKHNKM